MSKLERISDDGPTKKFPRIKTQYICKYNSREEVTRQYNRTYCLNCVDGKIISRVRKTANCQKYKKY